MLIKYENLTVHDISTNETFSKSFVFDAPNRKMNELGKLAVVVDVDMNTDFASKMSEIISECIKQEYLDSKHQKIRHKCLGILNQL